MNKVVKWAIILFASVLGIILAALIALYTISGSMLNKTYNFQMDPVAIPADQASIERGDHLVKVVFLCTQCHGENLAGQVIVDEPMNGRLVGSNLTSGKGGLGQEYTDADWMRAIRHGVRPDKKAGIFMMSNLFYTLSDSDLGAMIAFLKSLPPVDNQLPKSRLGPMGRLFVIKEPGFILPAMDLPHSEPRPSAPQPGVTVEYGKYLAGICSTCHGPDFGGGMPEGGGGGEEGAPPNLTPAGDLASWTEEGFVKTIRTGVTPQGKRLDPEKMPWRTFGKLSDDELKAIWLFLRSLTPVVKPASTSSP